MKPSNQATNPLDEIKLAMKLSKWQLNKQCVFDHSCTVGSYSNCAVELGCDTAENAVVSIYN